MTTLLQDVRYALRVLWKSPGFTSVAVLSLALGVGANTAIFSIVNAVLLRSLPFSHPERLVKIVASNSGVGARDIGLSVPEFDDLRSTAGVFDEVTALQGGPTNLTGGDRPQRFELLEVSPNYFSMLGTSAHIGRVFGPEDEAPGFAEAAIISDSLWARAFGRDPGVLGRKIQLDNDPYTIVGVLPPGFRHPGSTVSTDIEIWVTCGFRANPFPKPERSLRILPAAIGLLKPGIGLEQAQSRLDAFASQLRAEYATDYPAGSGWSIELEPLQDSLVGNVRPMLFVLMGAVVLIVVLASVNVANLLLARASGRQREVAIRLAMGASRERMIRQMLTESVMLSLVSGAIGLLTAMAALRFAQFLPVQIPRLAEVQVDWAVLSFALLVSLLAGLGFGLVPALQFSKAELAAGIREGTRASGTSGKTHRLRGLLIASETALAVMLMVGAGLLLRTFWGLLQENPGFNPSGIVAANVYLPVPNNPDLDRYYSRPEILNAFVREVVRRVGALPGVDLAAMTTDLPVAHLSLRRPVSIEDRPDESGKGLFSEITSVTPEYFKVLQASLSRGRYFTEDDDLGKQQVAIVDESTARTWWPDRDPIGRRLSISVPTAPGGAASPPSCIVVGVIKDINSDGLDQSGSPHVYRPIYQFRGSRALTKSVTVRTSLSAASLEAQIRREIQAVDPNLPVFSVRTMNDVIGGSLASRRFSAELVGVFAVVALLLASVGVYGLLAYMVGQRSHEIGLRMALGAMPSTIGRMIVSHGAGLAGIGAGIGLLVSGILAPLISSVLYGVKPLDPQVFIAVPVLLMVVVLLASYIPAWRAARVNPIVALRRES